MLLILICNFRYICSIEENAKEGTQLVFEGGLDKVEDPDKVLIIQLLCNIGYFVLKPRDGDTWLLFLRHTCLLLEL